MALEIVQVDAFTDKPFAGNPAAVCLLDKPRETEWMQAVAREMNTSGTAFMEQQGQAYAIRFFTPGAEVELSGHTTLSSAHVLWESGRLPRESPAHFTSGAGPLAATWREGWIELDFPALPEAATEPPPGLAEALGVSPAYVGRNTYDLLVEVKTEREVRELKPDFARLREIPTRGVMVTARSETAGYDFISRFFAPSAGLDEDPVTGSAHCCLAPFWAARLGKEHLVGYQASARGGAVRARPAGGRVLLAGQAVTVLRGQLAPRAENP